MQRTSEPCEQLEREAHRARRERERAGNGPGHPELDRWGLALTWIAVARIGEDPALVPTRIDR
ncbi:MAG: hypothetical protein F4Y02_18155 [Chloroflexi bacterium]|nr:hypothetical protein [Chloroflexota bacterium]